MICPVPFICLPSVKMHHQPFPPCSTHHFVPYLPVCVLLASIFCSHVEYTPFVDQLYLTTKYILLQSVWSASWVHPLLHVFLKSLHSSLQSVFI
jgi:hypothetical protein